VSGRRYRVLLADPPWSPSDALPGGGRGAAKHYRTMPTDALAELAVGYRIGLDSSVCAMWCPESMLPDGLRVLRAWGYQFKQLVHWVKPQMGMGRLFRVCTEVALVGVRGAPGLLYVDRKDAGIRNHFDARRRGHSEKPDDLHEAFERLLPGPYIELFARRERPGWDCIGDDSPRTAGQDITTTLYLIEKGQGQWAMR
jgi:N6-adenosine-specific RNA methylase IME4